MEPEEIAEFSKQMREAGEESLTHVSLIISVLAVLVAMVTVMSHREHTEAVLAQARATDRWNEYQARHIRQFEVSLAADALSLRSGSGQTSADAQLQTKIAAKLAEYKERQTHTQEQLNEDSGEAHKLEAEVNVAERKAARFDLGEALLQIGVVLASVTLLTRQWRYVMVALALGISGIVAAVSAFLVR